MYSFSIRQFIWECIGVFFWKVPLCIRFQLGNSFGNTWVIFTIVECLALTLF